jgi:hypothetical protein
MRRAAGIVALTLWLANAGMAKPPAKKAKTATAASVVAALTQMERDWYAAGAKRDSEVIDRILADDWVSTDFHGKTVTKSQALAELKSASRAAQSIDLGNMKVRVFGTTAIVTGTDATDTYAWMDVFLKRNGRWQAVASQSTRIVK